MRASPKKRRQPDPLEQAIETALAPGRFIFYKASWPFVEGLQKVSGKLEDIAGTEPDRAVCLYATFIAASHEKAEEIDDSSGEFGMLVQDLFCGWIKARQAAGAAADETAKLLLTWMQDDPYGFCHDLDRKVVKVLDKDDLEALGRQARAKFKTAAGTATNGNDDRQADYERRCWCGVLKTVLAARRNVAAYVALCEETELEVEDCKVVAEIYQGRRHPQEALEWVERGLDISRPDASGSFSDYKLRDMKRVLLVKLGRSEDALESAWIEFLEHPSTHGYKELMRYVPVTKRKAWHEKAMEASEQCDLASQIDLWLEKMEVGRLVARIDTATNEELEQLSHYATEPLARKLDRPHPENRGQSLQSARHADCRSAQEQILRRGDRPSRPRKEVLREGRDRGGVGLARRRPSGAALSQEEFHGRIGADCVRRGQAPRADLSGASQAALAERKQAMTSTREQRGPAAGAGKTSWEGVILSVQPRIRLLRSFDQLSHSYLGYVLCLRGAIGGEARDFLVAVGQGAHPKHQFQAGDRASGWGVLVADPRTETAELYKVSKFQVRKHSRVEKHDSSPWLGIPPELPVYSERGHRRLNTGTYKRECSECIWGCRMAVEIIVDQWNPQRKKYREETFCYGPLSCPLYKAGPTRKVPGRKGMSWEEADWIETEGVSHREPDD